MAFLTILCTKMVTTAVKANFAPVVARFFILIWVFLLITAPLLGPNHHHTVESIPFSTSLFQKRGFLEMSNADNQLGVGFNLAIWQKKSKMNQ
jgi:hypothetical protein